uniref:Transcriptional adapter 3 n=1 Tax=Denticeps clupeoides TaxID=299321 RepID=A0AAY4CBM0_9TELE
MTELQDCPATQLLRLQPVEHVKVWCRAYTASSLELETLLSSANRRLRILTDWQDKKGDKRFPKPKDSDLSVTSRHSRPKKQKLDGRAATGRTWTWPAQIQKPAQLPRNPKNDAPNRFWASVEPYCADITNEEIQVLEELLKPPDDEAEYHKIPALGKHYSQRWAQEDLLEEQREGARANDKKKSMMGPLSELDAKDVDALLKKSEAQHEPPEDGCPFGPLTQRLLQALVEENIISQGKAFRRCANRSFDGEFGVADLEVMEVFRRIMAARQKKRTPTKKEKDQAWKALKERESILKLLDG